MKSKVIIWLKYAKDDLDTIKHIVEDVNLSNVVAFHAQQAIEKSFKALISQRETKIKKTHDLLTLYKLIDTHIVIDNMTLLELVNKTYIETRYPGSFGFLPSGKPTLLEAKEFYDFAQNIFNQVCKVLNVTNVDLIETPS